MSIQCFNRISLLTLVASLLSAVAFAQNGAPSSDPRQRQDPTDHGLTLILTQDQTSERPESDAFKACLVNYPPAACTLLTLTIKNEGKETLLHWSATCGGTGIGFDLRKPDGNWETFPTECYQCAGNFVSVQSLPPGKSLVVRLRLSDRSLELDVAIPPNDGLIHTNKGYALIAGTGPYTIRARWYVWGCAASDKLNGDNFNLSNARSLCVNGTVPKGDFALVVSNALELKAKP